MVCLMVAVNVAMTKTPVSTTVILSVIADTSMVPVIVIASLTRFLLTRDQFWGRQPRLVPIEVTGNLHLILIYRQRRTR